MMSLMLLVCRGGILLVVLEFKGRVDGPLQAGDVYKSAEIGMEERIKQQKIFKLDQGSLKFLTAARGHKTHVTCSIGKS